MVERVGVSTAATYFNVRVGMYTCIDMIDLLLSVHVTCHESGLCVCYPPLIH